MKTGEIIEMKELSNLYKGIEAVDAAEMPHTVRFSKITPSGPYYMKIIITQYEEEVLPEIEVCRDEYENR